jgi:hypothetical protein
VPSLRKPRLPGWQQALLAVALTAIGYLVGSALGLSRGWAGAVGIAVCSVVLSTWDRTAWRDLTRTKQWERAKTLLACAFLLATVPNTIEAFGDPSGLVWKAVRFALSSLFVAALVYWFVALVRHKRR